MPKPLDFKQYEAAQQRYADLVAQQVLSLYETAVGEAVRLITVANINPNKPFRFADYPATNDRLSRILQNLSDNLFTIVTRSVEQSWNAADDKQDVFVQTVELSTASLNTLVAEQQAKALAAFQARKVGGLNLSQRVFNYRGQFATELENGLAVGLANGQSARQLAVSMNRYLVNPGEIVLNANKISNPAYKGYIKRRIDQSQPGRGVYASAAKNAERLTRTEINIAYRTADFNRVQDLDFVVGVEVRRSGRLSTCDICGPLAGVYPKGFKFVGWHPQCRCYTVPILVTAAELTRLNELTLKGRSTARFTSVNAVQQPHEGFREWLESNRARIDAAPVKPLFISQNKAYI